jgi:hypothetical protein
VELLKAIKEMKDAKQAKIDASMKDVLARMKAMKAKLDSRSATLDAYHERMVAHLEKMEATELKALHAAVKPVGGLRKRHRGQNLAAEHRHKLQDGSQRKLATTRRPTTLHAKVAWHKGNVGKIGP